jgi:hypothetical protein
MSEPAISAQEVRSRLAALCLGGGRETFPRNHRDRAILFQSVLRMLPGEELLDAATVGAGLQRWISEVAPHMGVDHVTLRRMLVDAGYLARDDAGSWYRTCPGGSGRFTFGPGVEEVDPAAVIHEARSRAQARRLDWERSESAAGPRSGEGVPGTPGGAETHGSR